MGRKLSWMSGLGIGALLSYLFDPDRGRRRRALVRDKTGHYLRKAGDSTGKLGRHLRNRVRGVGAETAARLQREEDVPDEVLVERVRAEIGHVVAHPGAIEVAAQWGRVTLSGPVLASEVDGLLARVRGVRGVTEIEDRLEVHESPDGVPGLQGTGRKGGEDREPEEEV